MSQAAAGGHVRLERHHHTQISVISLLRRQGKKQHCWARNIDMPKNELRSVIEVLQLKVTT